MINLYKILLIVFTVFLLSSCVEKVSYSGKIINKKLINAESLKNKNEVLEYIGTPNFIDPIENKYYYYSEKKITKNFFNQKIVERLMIVFLFNKSDEIIFFNKYDLDDQKDLKYIKEQTKNNIIDRGLIEKIFGGVGIQKIPDTSQ